MELGQRVEKYGEMYVVEQINGTGEDQYALLHLEHSPSKGLTIIRTNMFEWCDSEKCFLEIQKKKALSSGSSTKENNNT